MIDKRNVGSPFCSNTGQLHEWTHWSAFCIPTIEWNVCSINCAYLCALKISETKLFLVMRLTHLNVKTCNALAARKVSTSSYMAQPSRATDRLNLHMPGWNPCIKVLWTMQTTLLSINMAMLSHDAVKSNYMHTIRLASDDKSDASRHELHKLLV